MPSSTTGRSVTHAEDGNHSRSDTRTLAVAACRPRLIPALPVPAWLVLGGDFLSAVGSGLTLPFLRVYLHQVRCLGYAQAGLVLATVALASVAGNPVGGILADRWGPVPALRLGLAVAAGGSAAIAGVHNAPEAFAAAAFLGFGLAVAWPAQDTLLATLAGPAGRSAVFSVRHATLNAGPGLGALAAAVIVKLSQFAIGESLLSPTLAAVVNDLAPAEGSGRYNAAGALAYTAGFSTGPAAAGAALGAGRGSELFLGLIAACALTALASLALARHLPAAVNTIAAS